MNFEFTMSSVLLRIMVGDSCIDFFSSRGYSLRTFDMFAVAQYYRLNCQYMHDVR